MTAYRCKYRLSNNLVVAAAFGAGDGAYDDADHGTTVEFDGDTLPVPYTNAYDATPGSEQLTPIPDHRLDIVAPDPMTRGQQVQLTVRKVDDQGAPVGSGGETVNVGADRGVLQVTSVTFVNGEATLDYTPPDETIAISVWARDPEDKLTTAAISRTLANP